MRYDANGNQVEISNVRYHWTNGRQLSSITYIDDDGAEQPLASYTYDDNGIRTSKTYGDTTTYYTNVDGAITSQYCLDEDGAVTDLMQFLYDGSNELLGFTYNNNTYFYVKNLQGDIIAVIDSTGTEKAVYEYGAYGRLIYSDGDLADVNPMRYRGYYYDSDFGGYYLQSRYYAPEFAKFINSDLPEYAQQQKADHYGTNLFAYCCNDPVNNVDPSGNSRFDICRLRIPDSKKTISKVVDCQRILSFSGKKFRLVYPKSADDFWKDKTWKFRYNYRISKFKFNAARFFNDLGELESVATAVPQIVLAGTKNISYDYLKVYTRTVKIKHKKTEQAVLIMGSVENDSLFKKYAGKTTYILNNINSTVESGLYIDSVKSKYKKLTKKKSPYKTVSEGVTVDSKHAQHGGSYFVSCDKSDIVFLRPIIFKNDKVGIYGHKFLKPWNKMYSYKLCKSIKTNYTISELFGKIRRK